MKELSGAEWYILDRVYHGSVSMLMNGFVECRKLTSGEIEELRKILDDTEV